MLCELNEPIPSRNEIYRRAVKSKKWQSEREVQLEGRYNESKNPVVLKLVGSNDQPNQKLSSSSDTHELSAKSRNINLSIRPEMDPGAVLVDFIKKSLRNESEGRYVVFESINR